MTQDETKRLMLLAAATPNQLKRIDAILEGRDAEQIHATIEKEPEPFDHVLTREQVAKILGCTTKTVTTYVQRGLIRAFRDGPQGTRARGYSERSIREFMSRGTEGRV